MPTKKKLPVTPLTTTVLPKKAAPKKITRKKKPEVGAEASETPPVPAKTPKAKKPKGIAAGAKIVEQHPIEQPATTSGVPVHLTIAQLLHIGDTLEDATDLSKPGDYGWYCWVRAPLRIAHAMPGLIRKVQWWAKVMALDAADWQVWFTEALEAGKPVITINLRDGNGTGPTQWLVTPELPDGTARVHRADSGKTPDLYTNWSEAKMAIKAALKAELKAIP